MTPRETALLERVRERLVASNALVELYQFDGMSEDEQKILVTLEAGWGPAPWSSTPEPASVHRIVHREPSHRSDEVAAA